MEEGNRILMETYQKALLPNVIMALGSTIPVFMDSILVGRKLGDSGIAAVNQSLVVSLFLCTLGSCIAAGAMAEASYCLGKNRISEANRIYCLSIEILFIIGVLLTVAGVGMSHWMAEILGSSDTCGYVESYIRISFVGSLWKLLLYIPVYFLRLQGKTKRMACLTFFMAFLNIVLEYFFIYGLDLGIQGAACASVIATASAALLGFRWMSGGDSSFQFRPVKICGDSMWNIIQSGSPLAANNFFSVVRLVLLGDIMNRAGGDALVAVFAITNSVNEFSVCVQNGIPQTGMTMLSILTGEKDIKAIRMLQNMQIIYGIRYSVGMALGIMLFSGKISQIFGCTANIRLALILFALGIVPATLNSVMSYYYFAQKRSGQANFIIFLRVLFFAVAFAWLLSGSGDWVFLFYPFSELMTAVCWLLLDWRSYRRNSELSFFYLLDECTEKEGRSISYTIPCDPECICNAASQIEEFCRHNGFTPGQQNGISLSLEEILVIISEKSLGWQGTIDVRVLSEDDGGILRFRSAGKYYNPIESAESEQLDYLGIRMIIGLAKKVEYQSTLGLNTLLVEI